MSFLELLIVDLRMAELNRMELDFEIDKLTHSIENAITGDSFKTDISLITISDHKLIKKKDWVFDWKKEYKDVTKSVYKLAIEGNTAIQGL